MSSDMVYLPSAARQAWRAWSHLRWLVLVTLGAVGALLGLTAGANAHSSTARMYDFQLIPTPVLASLTSFTDTDGDSL
jgi:hypothetical protein